MELPNLDHIRCLRLRLLQVPHVTMAAVAWSNACAIRSTPFFSSPSGLEGKRAAIERAVKAVNAHAREADRLQELRKFIVNLADQTYRDLFDKDLPS